MRYRLIATFTMSAIAMSLCVASASGQTTPRVEITIQAAGLTAISSTPQTGGSRTLTPGVAGQVNVPVAPRISLEGRITAYPQRLMPDADQGGQAFEVLGGVRAEFMRTRRAVIHGFALAGGARFSNTRRQIDSPDGPATRFVLSMGGDVAFDVTTHVFVTGSAGIRLTRVPGSITCLPDVCFVNAAQVTPPWEFGAGAGVRFGQSGTTHAVRSAIATRLTVGGQAGYRIAADRHGPIDLHESAGPTVFGSYRLTRGLDLEAMLASFAQQPSDSAVGGRLNQAALGVKTGFRTDRVGAFVKILAGVNGYTNGANEITIYSAEINFATHTVDRSSQVYGSRFEPALDIGGVLELYVRKRVTIRFDASDSVAFFREVSLGATPSSDSMRFAAGLGWRF